MFKSISSLSTQRSESFMDLEPLAELSQKDEALKVLYSKANDKDVSDLCEVIESLYARAVQAHDESGSGKVSDIPSSERQSIGRALFEQLSKHSSRGGL